MIESPNTKSIVDGEAERNRRLHSPEYKNPVQNLVFLQLGYIEGLDDGSREGKINMEIVTKYSPIMRKIINGAFPESEGIQDLILEKRFEEAADLMIEEIHKLESQQHAA